MTQKLERIISFFSWLIITLFIGYFKLSYHELWKDEWQAWFVARDMSIGKLLSFLYYEGHPALWYLYLKIFTPFSQIVTETALLSFAHLVVISSAIWVLFFKVQGQLLLKWLYVLSYFFFFEYGIINRGYALVVLLSLMVIWQLQKENRQTKTLLFALFLLCQTEVYGAMMAMGFGVVLWAKAGYTIKTEIQKAGWVILSGLLCFVLSVFPRTSGHVAKTKGKMLSLTDTWLTSLQGNLSNAFLPGGTKDTFVYGWTIHGLLLSAFVIAALYWIFRKQKHYLLPLAFFTGMMILFSALVFMGGIRQWGMGYVFFMSLLLLQGLHFRTEKISLWLVLTLSIFQMVHGFRALKEDFKLPFTNALEAGLFIREKVPEKVPVVAINKFETAPVGGYAGRKFYELPSGTPFSYFRWVDRIYIPTQGEIQLFARYKNVGGVVIISPTPLDEERFPSAKLWKQFTSLNYKNENYFLYSLPVK